MSSNKTNCPGMENATTGFGPGFPNFPNNPATHKGTVTPGMAAQNTPNAINQKPILGFLFSVSRTPSGEFWPLHLGLNSIGRSADCDICLGEGTISEHHADLVIRQMKNPAKTICSIQDAKSTCGTMVNDMSVAFDPMECKNGDILTLGEHYQFYLVLIDVKELGLSVCPDFIATDNVQPMDDIFPIPPSPVFPTDGGMNNFTKGTMDITGGGGFVNPNGGTKAL